MLMSADVAAEMVSEGLRNTCAEKLVQMLQQEVSE